MTSILDNLIHSYGYWAVFIFIALESVGLPLPGETMLIAAAVYAGSTHHLNIDLIAGFAAVASIVGDNIGYRLGAAGGQRLVNRFGRFLRLDAAKMRLGRYFFDRHGAAVVFLGRFITVVRTYSALFAGIYRMPWRRFAVSNAAGGLVWAAVYSFGAYFLGSAAAGVGQMVTVIGLAVSALLAVLCALLMKGPMRRAQRLADQAYPELSASSYLTISI